LYTIQFVNVYSQHVLREIECDTLEEVRGILLPLGKSNGQETFLLDNERKLHQAEYVSHIKIPQRNIYKAFFKVKLHKKQPIIQ
jgi:hypothetical protein